MCDFTVGVIELAHNHGVLWSVVLKNVIAAAREHGCSGTVNYKALKKNLPIITSKRTEQSMLSVLMFTDDRAFRLALSGSLEERARLKTYLWYHFHKPLLCGP